MVDVLDTVTLNPEAPRPLSRAEFAPAVRDLVRLFTAAEVGRVCGSGAGNVGRWVKGNVIPRIDSVLRLEIWHHAVTILRENHPDDGLVNWFYHGADDVKIEWEYRRSPIGLLSEYETDFIGPVIIAGARTARARYPRLGRTPHHVAERYAAGEITRDQVIEQLSSWNYVPENAQPEWDIIPGALPSSFRTVTTARKENLIDNGILGEVLEIIEGKKPQLPFVGQNRSETLVDEISSSATIPDHPLPLDLVQLFLSLLAGAIADDPSLLAENDPEGLGHVRHGRAYLVPKRALEIAQKAAAARGTDFASTPRALGAALFDADLVTKDRAGNLQVGRRIGGRLRRVWDLPATSLESPLQTH